jgi:N-methylhydantoinase A
MALRVGVDVGGTFTDFVVFDDASGQSRGFKVSSMPDEPAEAVLTGFRRLAAEGAHTDDVSLFVHGTTIALNALLQRRGARVGLLITRGFRDVLQLRRLRLAGAPSFFVEQRPPLVPRRDIREVGARILADGREVRPLDPAEAVAAAEELVEAGCEALAICFLHAYRDNSHERAAAAAIRERLPHVHVTLSSEIWPQQREYERTQVAVINAHVAPVMERYFDRLVSSLADVGVRAPVFSTKSSGGIMSAARAAERPVETLLSGPASGVVAAAALGRAAGYDQLIPFDMGGTSADIGLVEGGAVRTSTENAVGDFPVIMPAVDVASIGAGGGSIAWVDASRVLKVGPRSAGADPGPACYGRGTQEPTITDAYVTLGMLDPARFLGGEVALDAEAARHACARIGAPLGLGAAEAAEAIIRVATSNMFASLLPLMAQRGANPRDFTLLAYGGAGPTHAFYLAQEVGFRRVVVPAAPGTFCALGCLVADIRADFVRTVYAPLDELSDERLTAPFAALRAEADRWLREERVGVGTAIGYAADMRYRGQSYEIAVALPEPDGAFRSRVVERFTQTYERIYGYSDAAAPVELVNARAHVIGVTPKPPLATSTDGGARASPQARRRIRFAGGEHDAAVYERAALSPGTTLAGPAVVLQYDTTTFVPPGYRLEADGMGNLVGGPAP